ncbi:hypothetical protein VKT23_017408 [Stygiomarasmius scandens]|uniref:Uncharacterized protein n=1 Tax=Marasmiellus scandens TaxID=2682957 RepID=A0ABR1ITU4_9AGAR
MQFSTLLTLATTVLLVQAGPTRFTRRQETDVNKCRPLGTGQCTLNVLASLTVVPAPSEDPSNGLAGAVSGSSVNVFDNNCNSIYVSDQIQPQGTGKGFSGPIQINGAAISAPNDNTVDFHADTIGTGDVSGVTSTYLGQTTSDCDCEADGSGLEGVTSCRCPFPC